MIKLPRILEGCVRNIFALFYISDLIVLMFLIMKKLTLLTTFSLLIIRYHQLCFPIVSELFINELCLHD